MAKKNYLKELPKLGGTAVMTMAMAAALATPASATEVEGAPVDVTPVDTAPVVDVVAAAPAAAPAIVEPAEVPAANAEITQTNTEAAAENTATGESNQAVDAGNQNAAAENSSATNGDLPAPALPDLPETPVAPQVPNTDGLNTEDQNAAVGDYNDQVGDYNGQVDDYNGTVDEYNGQVDDYNTAADAYDKQAQENYQQDLDAYNKYEEEQKAYDEAYKEYEAEVERLESEHNAAQDQAAADHAAAEKEAYEAAKEQARLEHEAAEAEKKAQHEAAEKEAYEAAKDAAKTEHEAAEAEKKAQHEAAEKEAYEAAKEAANAEHEAAEAEKKAQHEAAEKEAYEAAKEAARLEHEAAEAEKKAQHEAAEKAAYEAAKKAEEDAYNADKKAYEDAVAKENQVYDEVSEYNNQIESKNDVIEDKNDALENDLHADLVTDIEAVGEINKDVTVDAAVLETLKGYSGLTNQLTALEEAATALENHAGKGAPLGSDEYAAYLADVEAYNDAVTNFNADAEAYNTAVETYNAAVEAFNQKKIEDAASNPSTGAGTQQGSANIDWGNVNFDGHFDDISEDHLTHIDVKYNAAASKEVTVETDAQGKETDKTYSDSVNQYTVTGVFTDKATADTEIQKQNPSYGLAYSNDDWKTSDTQALKKDAANDEFGNTSWSHTGENLDPVTGDIRFYVTLTDSEGKPHGININMNAGSVYADGSYYKAESNDFLQYYVGKDGKTLETETIDGVEYYKVSGESVFLISALTCDGMTRNGWTNKLTAHGLDLILNLQTLIEIHQSENAQKISFLGYELGKTAQAEKIDHKTYEELHDPFSYPDFVGTEYNGNPFQYPDFSGTEYEGTDFTYPEFVGTEYEGTDFEYPDFVGTEYEGTDFEYPDFVGTEYEREDFVAPEYDGPSVSQEVAPPEDIVPTQRLDHVEKLQKLDNMLYFIEEAPSYEPVVLDGDGPVYEAPTNLRTRMIITDEQVPLAKAPKTGDISSIWAAISSLSLGGMALLNRKRKEEE